MAGKIETKSSARIALEKQQEEYDLLTGRLPPSNNEWGKTGIDGEPASKKKDGGRGSGGGKENKLPAVPYDVPAPPDQPGLQACGTRLARFFIQAGEPEGGGGSHLGVTIDHVLDAVSRGRTSAGFDQPLMALLEVVYADVLLPTLDEVVVLEDECDFVLEKAGGIIKQAGVASGHAYAAVEPHVERLLDVLEEVYETSRQCQSEMLLANHLQDGEYPRALRKTLKDELTDRMCDTLWRLSTELLKLTLAELEAKDGDLHPDEHHELDEQNALRMQVLSHFQHRRHSKRRWRLFGRSN